MNRTYQLNENKRQNTTKHFSLNIDSHESEKVECEISHHIRNMH